MAGFSLELGPGWRAQTVCSLPFPPTFTGIDSFTYRVRDNEGAVSEPKFVTITIFEQWKRLGAG